MPDHHLHPYFRFLVEHQELLSGKSFEEVKKNEGGQGSGALFLLGSVYGTGEDEDTKSEAGMDSKINEADEGDNDVKAAVCSGPDVSEGTTKLTAEGDTVSKHPLLVKDKASVIKGNPSVSTVNVGNMNKTGSEDGIPEKLFASADKLQSSVVQTQPKLELPIVEPPADMKKVIDKIVEFILRNGKEFEAILAAQDVKYGRFPFLLPASLYHAYYRKVLREAEEPNPSGKDNISEKRDKKQEKRAAVAKENGKPAVGSDIPDDSVKKEKFKMVIGKPKKDVQDEPPKPVQPNIGVTIDADAAAAILQAARRGIKNPNLGILSSNPLYETSSQGLGSDNSQPSSQPSSLMKNIGQTSEHRVSGPAANAIAKSAALAAASEADSSEAGLSKEQKLKAERLKRAKMFVSLLKSGAEPARSLSIEPPDSGNSGSGANAVEPAVREREGSSVPFEAEKKRLDDDNNERRSKRNYRSRAQKNEDDEKDEEEGNSREETEETGNDKQSSKRRHSEHKRDMQKNRKGRSSKDRHSRDRHKHDSSSDDERHKRSRHRHKHGKSCHKHELDDSSDNEHRRRHRSSKHKHAGLSDEDAHHQHRSSKHKNADSSDDEHQHRCRSSRHKHADDSSDDEHCNRDRSSKSKKEDYCEDECGHRHKHSKRRKREKERIKEEITLKGEESEGHCGGQNETTQVSEELRAKIRAMLTGTL